MDLLNRNYFFFKASGGAGRSGGGKGGKPKIMTEEEYVSSFKGAARGDIGDAALHKNMQSGRQKNFLIKRQNALDKAVLEKRENLRKEYAELVNQGKIIPPTRIQRLQRIAQGHPDNESVQAARRLLKKAGKKW